MSSAGHVLDSIAKMKFNRDQLMARRERIADLKSMYHDSIKIEGYVYKEDHIPKEIVDRVKADIRRKIRKKRIRNTTLSLILTILIISAIVALAAKYVKI